MSPPRPSLIAFDLDGTVTRGPTVCEAISSSLGFYEEMRAFERATTREEITRGREFMAARYHGMSFDTLLEPVHAIPLAPGAREAVERCRAEGVRTVLLTITWTFAAVWFMRELGFDACAGTVLHMGHIDHFWPEDKATWLAAYAREDHIPQAATAAVGDSWGDEAMLAWAGRSVYVGATGPPVPGPVHMPDAPLDAVVDALLG